MKSGKERALEGAEIHGFTFLLCSLNLLWYFKFYYLMFFESHNSPTGDEYARTDKDMYFQKTFYFKFNSIPKFI